MTKLIHNGKVAVMYINRYDEQIDSNGEKRIVKFIDIPFSRTQHGEIAAMILEKKPIQEIMNWCNENNIPGLPIIKEKLRDLLQRIGIKWVNNGEKYLVVYGFRDEQTGLIGQYIEAYSEKKYCWPFSNLHVWHVA